MNQLRKLVLAQEASNARGDYILIDYSQEISDQEQLFALKRFYTGDELTILLNCNSSAQKLLLQALREYRPEGFDILRLAAYSEIPKTYYTPELLDLVVNARGDEILDILIYIVPDMSLDVFFEYFFTLILGYFGQNNSYMLVSAGFCLFSQVRWAYNSKYMLTTWYIDQIIDVQRYITPHWFEYITSAYFTDATSPIYFYIWTIIKLVAMGHFVDLSQLILQFPGHQTYYRYFEAVLDNCIEHSDFIFYEPLVHSFLNCEDCVELIIRYMNSGGAKHVFATNAVGEFLAKMSHYQFAYVRECYQEAYYDDIVQYDDLF